MAERNRLLIVDDDKIHRAIYSSIASKLEYAVDLAQSPGEAYAALRAADYKIVILDLMLGEESGADALALMSSLPKKPRVLLVTGASDEVIDETFAVGRQLGLEMFGPVRKPVNMALIRTMLRGMAIDATPPEIRVFGRLNFWRRLQPSGRRAHATRAIAMNLGDLGEDLLAAQERVDDARIEMLAAAGQDDRGLARMRKRAACRPARCAAHHRRQPTPSGAPTSGIASPFSPPG